MWPRLEWVLVVWTALAGCWWVVAFCLVRSRLKIAPTKWATRNSLTVFKPLPALREAAPSPDQIAALESVVSQLDDTSELLLGIEEPDGARWQPVVDDWRRRFPRAKLKVVCTPRPAAFLSPKVSWHHRLAREAEGELWLWSDADMIAPPGFLQAVREEFVGSGASLVTCPYVIRRVEAAPGMLEALFANVEFYPGVLACAAAGRVRFAFGAGLFFRADEFRRRVAWEELGARMADDYLMGNRLTPVKVSDITLETLAAETGWRNAGLHYLRWHKTVRWNRPGGYAGQLIILPVLGWLLAALWQPTVSWWWIGLAATIQMEAVAAGLLCRSVGCRLRHWWTVELWPLARALTWLACWLPWPVVFRSQNRVWWSLYRCTGENP